MIDLRPRMRLRVSNVSNNHDRVSIGRVGRALADASDKPVLEARLIAMIKDHQPDPFNRLLMAYPLNNYAHHLEKSNKADALKN